MTGFRPSSVVVRKIGPGGLTALQPAAQTWGCCRCRLGREASGGALMLSDPSFV